MLIKCRFDHVKHHIQILNYVDLVIYFLFDMVKPTEIRC